MTIGGGSRIGFQLTVREIDALLTLSVSPAAWPTFERRTWHSLVNKGLVTCSPKPALHPQGRGLRVVYKGSWHVYKQSYRVAKVQCARVGGGAYARV